MKRMRKQGYTLGEIGETFNMTRQRVKQILDKGNQGSIMPKRSKTNNK